VVAEEAPHVVITQCVEEKGVDPIALCWHGNSGRSYRLMGSVAGRVVRGASLPLLLVRAGRTQEQPSRPAVGESDGI
jgi:nucleotide-binding universal stress UspA family protein